MTPRQPSIELFPDPIVSAVCDGVPILAYGDTHVLQASPDLVEPESLQVGNAAACRKLPLKRSAEIGFNQLGGTTPRMPRTVANDYRPLEPIRLIDGDPTTCWCSRSVAQPEAEPAWIRLDLPVEREITRIVLRKRVPGAPRNRPGSMPLDQGAVEVGMALPQALTIRVARDGMTWETLFSGETGDSPELREFVCAFPAQRAKQIWIVGERLTRVENWHFSFSIAEVEVLDAAGNDWALARRGTGVTVSSTFHNPGQTREEHHRMWPLYTDMGLKWARIGYHDDPVNWHWVEREKGVLAMDPEADAAITYLVERGVDIVLALGFGNRLYQGDPVRHLPQLWEWYYENPEPPTTPEALEGWGRYVRFMCRKYRDRVKVFEVWNEWNISVYWGTVPNLEHYLAIARVAIPIIRAECPEARVLLGSVSGFCHDIARNGVPEPAKRSLFLGAVAALAPDVDLIGWHPFYQTDPDSPSYREYAANVRAFKAWAASLGFRGECLASEYNWGANYPLPAKPHWWGTSECSELEKAKLVAQISVLHTALGIGSFFCEVWGCPTYPLDLSLMRRAFNADPVTPLQPQAAYYAMRNLATALDGCQPAEFPYEIVGAPDDLQVYTMASPGECWLALWRSGRPVDDKPGVPVDLRLPLCAKVVGYDCLSGCEQELVSETDGTGTWVKGVLVRDYPLLVRLREEDARAGQNASGATAKAQVVNSLAAPLLPPGWNPVQAGNVVMSRLVNTSGPQVKGAHDAEFVCVGERAYTVAEANDTKGGESADWPFIYATLSIVNLKTLKLERVIDFAKSEQVFANETLPVGACFVPRILQKDARTLRCYFTSEAPGKRQSQMWYRDFDLARSEFATTIHRAKIKTAAGTFDFQPQYFHADAAAQGFTKRACDHSFFLFDSFKRFDGKLYVALNNFGGKQNALALVHDDLATFEVLGHFNEPQSQQLSESAVNRLPDGTWMAICRNDAGNYHFATSADGKAWTAGREMPHVPNGANSKPTFDRFGGVYYLGWQEATRIQGATRSVFNLDVSRDGRNWERKYRFETPKSFQYPTFHEHEGTIWLCVTQGDTDPSRKERIMFGILEQPVGSLFL